MLRRDGPAFADPRRRQGVTRGDGAPTVVKLGGSCVGSLDLRRWTAAVAGCARRVVVVPGGGRFADAVRAAQPAIGFDDAAAHHMALLAMEQLGRALASLDGRVSLADSTAALRRCLRENKAAVWLPTRMALGAADVPPSWDVTSDSLAAWLAGKISARRLLLMKQVELPPHPIHADDLARRGIVDKAFPRFLAASGAAAFILGPADHMAIAAALCDDSSVGTAIVSS
jgi:5-(aminomethyl)-3-furanmethanol phosphate kinase